MTEIPNLIVLLVALLLLTIVLGKLASLSKLPRPLLLVLGGFVLSEALVASGIDTGLRWYSFRDVVLHILLPILIFQSGLAADISAIRRILPAILLMSVPMLLLVIGLTTVVVYYGIGHSVGFPWLAAVYTAVLVSATDPSAIAPFLKQYTPIKNAKALLENESLFNDATIIVIFSVITAVTFATTPERQFIDFGVLLVFLKVFGGGIALGVLLGYPSKYLLTLLDRTYQQLLLLSIALGGFAFAEHLGVSGVMTVLVAGLLIKQQEKQWQTTAFTASSIMFLLAGMTITVAMFDTRWVAMLWGILAVLFARGLGLLLFMPLANACSTMPISKKEGVLLYWGGTRGTVTLALALSLPTTLESWFTVQSIAYGVVIFGLVMQSTTFPWLATRLIK